MIGHMNWVRVNRTAGYYLFDQHAVTHLAILIALGALKPIDHWQQPHQIGQTAYALSKELLDAMQKNTMMDWDTKIGLKLRNRISRVSAEQNMGWVTLNDLALLIKKINGESVEQKMEDRADANLSSKQLQLPF